jgi:hypothetical protein
MTTYNLSASVIKTLQPPSSGNRVFFDSEVSGFGLRVTANGARSFILNYRTVGGRERRKTIGAWPIWTATDARREAARLRHLVDQGGDPRRPWPNSLIVSSKSTCRVSARTPRRTTSAC